jgi:hypothetical protein
VLLLDMLVEAAFDPESCIAHYTRSESFHSLEVDFDILRAHFEIRFYRSMRRSRIFSDSRHRDSISKGGVEYYRNTIM